MLKFKIEKLEELTSSEEKIGSILYSIDSKKSKKIIEDLGYDLEEFYKEEFNKIDAVEFLEEFKNGHLEGENSFKNMVILLNDVYYNGFDLYDIILNIKSLIDIKDKNQFIILLSLLNNTEDLEFKKIIESLLIVFPNYNNLYIKKI